MWSIVSKKVACTISSCNRDFCKSWIALKLKRRYYHRVENEKFTATQIFFPSDQFIVKLIWLIFLRNFRNFRATVWQLNSVEFAEFTLTFFNKNFVNTTFHYLISYLVVDFTKNLFGENTAAQQYGIMKNLLSLALTEKKIRQINYLVIHLVKPLLSRNFCHKINFSNFHILW